MMGILYHFLSTLGSVGGGGGKPSPQIRWRDENHLLSNVWLPRAERNLRQLRESSIVQSSFVFGSVICAVQREVWIHFRRLLLEDYKEEEDGRCGFSLPLEWKESILPFMANHQATLWIMSFYKSLASTLLSEAETLQLCQHPYYRAKSLVGALEDKSSLSVATNAFVMTAWSSFLFYLASLTVRQVSFSYAQWKEYQWASVRDDSIAKGKSLQSWFKFSWETAYRQSLRCWYASLGSALGSIILPGWGTLIGTGLGEQWADHRDVPRSPPPALLSRFPQIQKYFVKSSSSSNNNNDNHYYYRDATVDSGGPLQVNELLCGCCQAVYFSSDPSDRKSAPMSSRTCEHTICRSCVDVCHLSHLQSEGVALFTTEDRLGCPICDADGAFSTDGNNIVNRNLCDAISLLEKAAGEAERPFSSFRSDQSSFSSHIEIDIGAVKKFGRRLSQLEIVAAPREELSIISA